MRRLCMELAGHYRNLMLCALPGGTSLLTGISPEEEAAYTQRRDFPQREAIRAVNAFGSALEKMSRGTDQRIELELAIFSLTQPEICRSTCYHSSSPPRQHPPRLRRSPVRRAPTQQRRRYRLRPL